MTNVRPGPDGGRPRVEGQRAVVEQVDVGPDGADRDLGRHLVGARHDRQAIAEVEEPVPLEDRRVVEPGDSAWVSIASILPATMSAAISAYGSGKWARDRQPAGGPAAIGPVGEQDARARRPSALRAVRRSPAGWSSGGRRGARRWPSTFWRFSVPTTTIRRPAGSAIEPHRDRSRSCNRSPHCGREQVDDVDVLGGRLEQRGRRAPGSGRGCRR